MTRIKTDATPYVHKRTGERYLARHAGLMKIGHPKRKKGEEHPGWTECVMYQKEAKPSEWFARDMPAFLEQFVEARTLAIQDACKALEMDPDMPHGVITMWAKTISAGEPVLTGDITEHTTARLVKQDATTGKVLFIDVENAFAICADGIYELDGEEVTLG